MLVQGGTRTRARDGSGRLVSKTTEDGLRHCPGCEQDLPCDIHHFGVRSWADRARRLVRHWKHECRDCCARHERERIARIGTSPERKEGMRLNDLAYKERERRRLGVEPMPLVTYVKRYGRLPPVPSLPFSAPAYVRRLRQVAPAEPDPIEALSEGGGGLTGWSRASADYECVHGRLPGDECPQPAMVPGTDYNAVRPPMVPNPDRLWPHDEPCPCWGGK